MSKEAIRIGMAVAIVGSAAACAKEQNNPNNQASNNGGGSDGGSSGNENKKINYDSNTKEEADKLDENGTIIGEGELNNHINLKTI